MLSTKITIIPEGGLCNRMRAINAAQGLCHSLNTPLAVRWLLNSDLNCSYEHLFSAPTLELKNCSNFYFPALVSRLKRKSQPLAIISSIFERLLNIQIIDSNELLKLSQEQLIERIEKRKRTYLCAWFSFFGNDDFTGFSPSPTVEQSVREMTSKFTPSTIGIHIRRTDNAIAIASSPLELFISKIATYPTETTFFLATDSQIVKTTLLEKFPTQIITPHGSLSRNSTNGMTQAAAELFALSCCKELLASHWSSFSDAAAQIGSIPKIVIQKPTTMELIIASANAHKITELAAVMPSSISLVSLKEIGITEDIPETADTLEGNALQKAHYIFSRTAKACFADDTGLEVEALDGAPGVHSARYAQIFDPATASHDASANVALLLKNLENASTRQARFRTVIALILPDGSEHLFEGVVNGHIISDLRGVEGFGYDPIFIPQGYDQTFAQMPSELKNRISHRGLAAQKLIAFLQEWQ